MSRGRMTMRAEVERNTAVGTDTYGHGVAPVFQAHATLACFVWSNQKRSIADGGKTAVVEDLRAMFPIGADVRAGDEIAKVTNRLSIETLAGRFRIETIQRKHRHLEAALLRVQ